MTTKREIDDARSICESYSSSGKNEDFMGRAEVIKVKAKSSHLARRGI